MGLTSDSEKDAHERYKLSRAYEEAPATYGILVTDATLWWPDGYPNRTSESFKEAVREALQIQEGDVPTTAVQDRSTVTEALAIEALGLALTLPNAGFTRLLGAVKDIADGYLNNPFTDDAGDDETIPLAVEQGVIRLLSYMLITESSTSGGAGTETGVKRIKTGMREVEFLSPLVYLSQYGLPNDVMLLWSHWRHNPGM